MKKLILCLIILSGCLPLWKANAQQSVGPAEVQQAENQLTQVYQQLMGKLSPADQQKLKQSETQWIKNKEASIVVNKQNADVVHYNIVQGRISYLSGFLNGSAHPQTQPIARNLPNVPPSIKSGITNQRSDLIEGVNSDKDHWAYEFLDNNSSSKTTIYDSSKGLTVFENPEWIVKASEKEGNVGKVQTELFFFDAKTIALIATCRIPNKLISVGRTDSTFYVLTITPGKYRFDDAPLVLTLIQPKEKNIDRITLVEDKGLSYWFALGNPIKVDNVKNTIVISYDANADRENDPDGYVLTKLNNKAFADTQIELKPEANNQILTSAWGHQGGGMPLEKINYINQGSAGLEMAGISESQSKKTQKNAPNSSISIVDRGNQVGTHIDRSFHSTVTDLNINNLIFREIPSTGGDCSENGSFRDGTLFYRNGNGLNIIGNSGTTNIAFGGMSQRALKVTDGWRFVRYLVGWSQGWGENSLRCQWSEGRVLRSRSTA